MCQYIFDMNNYPFVFWLSITFTEMPILTMMVGDPLMRVLARLGAAHESAGSSECLT